MPKIGNIDNKLLTSSFDVITIHVPTNQTFTTLINLNWNSIEHYIPIRSKMMFVEGIKLW